MRSIVKKGQNGLKIALLGTFQQKIKIFSPFGKYLTRGSGNKMVLAYFFTVILVVYPLLLGM